MTNFLTYLVLLCWVGWDGIVLIALAIVVSMIFFVILSKYVGMDLAFVPTLVFLVATTVIMQLVVT